MREVPAVSRGRSAVSVAVLALLYLWVFPYHAVVGNPNENVRVYMTAAVVDDGTFAINRVEALWGYTNDKAMRDTPLAEAIERRHIAPDVLRAAGVPDDVLDRFRRGRATPADRRLTAHLLYSGKAPGASLLAVPGYWLLTRITGRDTRPTPPHAVIARPPIDRALAVYVMRLTACVLPSLVFAWFWHRFLAARARSGAVREAVFFSTMAGSSVYAYGLTFASHAHNAYGLAAGLMCLAALRERDAVAPAPQLGLAFLAGLFGASCAVFEYPAALASAVVAAWIVAQSLAADRPARILAAMAGGALPLSLALLYHQRAFGNPLHTGYSHLENTQFRSEVSQGFFGAGSFSWEAAVHLWFDPAYGMIPSTFVLALFAPGLGAMLAWRPASRELTGVVRAVFGAAMVFALARLAVAVRAHGSNLAVRDVGVAVVALTATVTALASVTLPTHRRDRPMALAVGAVVVALTFLIGSMNNWRGGWQIGPRYLATLIPALGIAALAGLDALAAVPGTRRPVTVFAAGATLCAFVATGLASAVYPHLPEQFHTAFFELVGPMLRAGYVPFNAGHALGMETAASMWGFALGAVAMAVIVLRGDERRPVAMVAHALGGLAVTLLLLAPMAAVANMDAAFHMRHAMTSFDPKPPKAPPRTLDAWLALLRAARR
jgi:hypothetical protein